MDYDLLIRNGRVVDGSGLPSYIADVGIKDGKIVEIGRLTGAKAKPQLPMIIEVTPCCGSQVPNGSHKICPSIWV